MDNELIDALVKLDRTKVLEIIKKEIEGNANPLDLINYLSQGMRIVGDYFEKKEYYLAELITAGDIFKNAFQELEPILKKRGIKTQVKGKVAMGTVQGDIHDIGKNIVITLLRASGFHVVDLGVDVPAEKFIETIKQQNIKIIGLSALLTTSINSVNELIKLLEGENLRKKVKLIVGGSAFTEDLAKKLGMDAFGKDPLDGIKKCLILLE